VLSLISPKGYTITGENLITNPGYTKPGSLQPKRGNLGQRMSKPISFLLGYLLTVTLTLTYYISKQLLEFSSQHGGKTAEKANAGGNASDTRKVSKTFKPTGLLLCDNRLQNSVSQIKVSNNSFARNYSTQDLLTKSRYETSITDLKSYNPLEGKKIIESKQIELVRLAEKHGLHDTKVYDLQLILVRSLAFREYSTWLILSKPCSATPGMDKESLDTDNKAEMFVTLVEYLRDMTYHSNKYQPTATKRVWIPKPGKSEKRHLGTPTIRDRAMQSLVNLVLDPLVELTSDPNSYGFRTHRDCKLAIAALRARLITTNLDIAIKALKTRFNNYNPGQRWVTQQRCRCEASSRQVTQQRTGLPKGTHQKSNENKWILDADIKGFFDNISHDWLIKNLFLHPTLKSIVNKWLKAKILDASTNTNPINGTPQGGIISPTLANFTLNGLEDTILKSIYPRTKTIEQRKPVRLRDGRVVRLNVGVSMVRYADDLVVVARSKKILNQYVTPAITKFLLERGLCLSPHKTKTFSLSHKNTQLDFLGYTFKFSNKWSAKRTMVFSRENSNNVIALYPNKEKVLNFILKLKQIISDSQNLTAMELISKLNPMIRGWAMYYNLENSSHYRSVVRNALYNMTWNWMRKKHPTLGKKKLALMYFVRKKASQKDVVDYNSPLPEPLKPNRPLEVGCEQGTRSTTEDKNIKIKNTKWTFHGISRTESRYSKTTGKTRIAYLLKPTDSSPILTATKYVLPLTLRLVHAFHPKIDELIKFKLSLSLLSSPKTPTLKEKLFKSQKGLCGLCNNPIDFESLHLNTVHINHIESIKKGGNKFKLYNLTITHSWCHSKQKH
jgi:group II intron reverse transcriptase/maturase